MLDIQLSPGTRKLLKNLDQVERRWDQAVRRFLGQVAVQAEEIVREEGAGIEYVDYRELEIVTLARKVESMDSVALVLPRMTRNLSSAEMKQTVVYFELAQRSDEGRGVNPALRNKMAVLREFSPWPTCMVQLMSLRRQDARIITRRVSTDEYLARMSQLLKNGVVRSWMAKWGVIGNQVPVKTAKKKLLGRRISGKIEAQEDVAWRVARIEFGLKGEQAQPHWRKMVRTTAKGDRYLAEKFIRYLLGDRRALPNLVVGTGGQEMFEKIEWFQGLILGRRKVPR